ncbi:MAG: CDP-glycerol glycerophosphotransferase family protein [Clostridia bacterium]|nr:CDP-glycerol glycerophosphotransferase family protein [Clostridia bacterium]
MKFLYIDPGTGSMLFTILISVIGAAIYSLRMLFVKIHSGILGKKTDITNDKIPFVIYSDDKRYWTIFEPICREMNKLGKEIVYITASEDDPVFNCGYEYIKPKCIGKSSASFANLNYLKANILLSTTPGLDVYGWKRSKDVDYYVHILHSAGEVVMYRMFGIDYYDALLLSGDYQIEDVRALEALRGLPSKELVKVGLPFMDEMVKRLKECPTTDNDKRTVLLAPSWGPNAIFNRIGIRIVDLLLETGYHLIIRPHPQSFESEKELMDELMAKYPASDKLEWNRDTDNFEVLKRADILVSDFSGIIYDFSLVYDKPVIYTNPNADVSLYDAWWLDKPLWKTTALPKLGKELTAENIEDIKTMIDACLEDPEYAKGRAEVKSEVWANFGHGTEKTVEYLLNKYDELTKKED